MEVLGLIVAVCLTIMLGAGTIAFPIVTYREIRDNGLGLFIVCWGLVVNALTVAIWSAMFFAWHQILTQ